LKHLISVPFWHIGHTFKPWKVKALCTFLFCANVCQNVKNNLELWPFYKGFFEIFLNYKKYKIVGLGLPYLKHMILWVTNLSSKIFLWMVANVATPQRWKKFVIVYMYICWVSSKNAIRGLVNRIWWCLMVWKLMSVKQLDFLLFLYHWWTHCLFLDIIHELILLCDKAFLYGVFGLWNQMFISYLFMKVQIFESWFQHNSRLHEKL
jgi:hypothetical protein